MNKLTGTEIIEKIKESGASLHEFAYDGVEENIAGPNKEVFSLGGEDKGSDWRRVYYFTDHDTYIQVRGYYQSHHGTDFDGEWNCVTEVKPKEKIITIYE